MRLRVPPLPLSIWRRPDARRVGSGLLALALLLGAKGSTDPAHLALGSARLRVAAASDRDLSAQGLRRVADQLTPSMHRRAQAVLTRAAWSPRGPEGWASYDLTAPALIGSTPTQTDAWMLNALLPISPLANPPMKPFVLKASREDAAQARTCLSQAIYYEAGFEPVEGQRAVAQVVLNRLAHPDYPKSVCGVVYQGSHRATGCQFSFTCDGSLAREPSPAAWLQAQAVAIAALAGHVDAKTGAATHYHAGYVFPYWAPTLVKIGRTGAHIFYRIPGPRGRPAAFTGAYAGGETAISTAILTGGDERTPDAPATPPPAPSTPLAAPVAPVTVTLTVGGDTQTYQLAPQGAPSGPPLPGVLAPIRRQPTAAEIAEINERLKAFEEKANAGSIPSSARPGEGRDPS